MMCFWMSSLSLIIGLCLLSDRTYDEFAALLAHIKISKFALTEFQNTSSFCGDGSCPYAASVFQRYTPSRAKMWSWVNSQIADLYIMLLRCRLEVSSWGVVPIDPHNPFPRHSFFVHAPRLMHFKIFFTKIYQKWARNVQSASAPTASEEWRRWSMSRYCLPWASPPGGMAGTCPPGSEFRGDVPPEIAIFKEKILNICQNF